ncbi:PUA-like domain-containing protein [Melampsora americana]|nr:PUA-like domain-containing protein [Melampsora americana]
MNESSQDLIQSIYTILNSNQTTEPTDHQPIINLITLDCGHSISNPHPQEEKNLTNLIRCSNPSCDQKPQLIPSINFTLQNILNHIRNQTESNVSRENLIQKISTELECSLCSLMFEFPSTTRCGHTFCKGCLERSLDYSTHCPVCRQTIHPRNCSIDQTIQDLITNCFKDQFNLRPNSSSSSSISTSSLLLEPSEFQDQVPLFICGLAFPKLPTFLHVFEPHYRFLIRNSLSTNRQFGIVLPKAEGGINQFGTLVEIKSIEFLQDGRSLVETLGLIRFEILEIKSMDGYQVGKVKWIEDIQTELESQLQSDSNQEESIENLMEVCLEFLKVLRSGSTPWVLQRLNNTFGPTPSDPVQFSYWMAMVLPMSDQHKSQLLPITSVRLRLKLIVHWIHGFK